MGKKTKAREFFLLNVFFLRTIYLFSILFFNSSLCLFVKTNKGRNSCFWVAIFYYLQTYFALITAFG